MNWKNTSKEVKSLEAEICFQLANSFYTGDPNDISQIQNDEFKEPNSLPEFERQVESIARTSEVVGHEDELANFYKQIVEKAFKYNKNFNSISSYFWLRLWLWETDNESTIHFPWYDSLNEMKRFFNALENYNNANEVYWDADQGWEINVAADEAYFYFRVIDPDEGEEYENIKVPKEDLLNRIRILNERATNIISSLSNSLGEDVWSKHLQDASFGTQEWQPNKKINPTKKADGFFRRLFKRYVKNHGR